MEQQNNEKLSDKAFARLALTSILGILFCIICLCSTTYAWFSDSTSSGMNQIKAGNACQLTVTVDGVELQNVDSGVEMALEAGKTYTVELSLPKESGSGYCVITAGSQSYYTDYIARHESETPKSIMFTLTVGESQTVVFTPRWGISASETLVADGDTLAI